MEEVERIEYRGFDIIVHPDFDPMNPCEEWDLLGTMACWHRRYTLGHEQPKCDPDEFRQQLAIDADPTLESKIDHWENGKGWRYLDNLYYDPENPHNGLASTVCDNTIKKLVNETIDKHYIILPLYLYDHSGITISTSPFSCPWDSGQVGFIYISKKKAKEEYNWKVLSKKRYQKIVTYLIGEVEGYDTYLTGQVYGYTIEPTDRNKSIDCDDSCWGFFGYDHEASGLLESAKGAIDWCITEYKKQVIKEHNRKKEMKRFMSFAWAC